MTGSHAEENILFVDQLLLADYHSRHAVFIDSNLTGMIEDSVSSNLKKWLYHIDAQTTKLASLVSYVNKVFVITDGHSNQQALPSCLRNKAVFVSLMQLQEKSLSSTVLLGENLDDCNFYQILALYYSRKNNILGYWCNCETENGGGSTTSQAFENMVYHNHRFCLCIADSDKHYAHPNAKKGTTICALNRVNKKIQNEGKGKFCGLLPLQVMEVENLIPYSLLERIFSHEAVCKEGLAILKSMVNTFPQDESNPALYYDLKKGLRIKDCAKCVHTPLAEYWRKVFENIQDEIVTQYDNYSEEEYTALSKAEKDCCVRKGLQQQEILSKSVRYINDTYVQKESIQTLEPDEYLVKIWDNIGRTVFTWTCASSKHSA